MPGPKGPGPVARVRSFVGPLPAQQLLLLAGVIALVWLFGSNVLDSMERLGIRPGFAFLSQQANFEIGESVIAYSSGDTYARALAAGFVNTMKVAFFGCLLATVLGVTLGIARLSGNLLLSTFVYGYVEILRSTPLLLQLFLWSALARSLPPPRTALSPVDGVFLSNRGVFLPGLAVDGMSAFLWLPLLLSVTALTVLAGASAYFARFAVLVLTALVLVFALLSAFGLSVSVDFPVKGGFNIRGGLSMTPEFAALLVGLVVNAAASISEIVRSGIQSVAPGQWEAARAIGLKRGQILRLVVIPQALRVITPLMTSSYLDLTKNSSLAVAIGFPDIVSVANTTTNTTGQAFEAITIIVVVYLTLNIGVSVLMNLYNSRVALKGGGRR